MKFCLQRAANRVVFGSGTSARVGDEADAESVKHPLVLSTPEQKNEGRPLAAKLGTGRCGCLLRASDAHPVEVTEKTLYVVTETKADGQSRWGGAPRQAWESDSRERILPQIVSADDLCWIRK